MMKQYNCLACNEKLFFESTNMLPNGHSASKAIMKCRKCDIEYNEPDVLLINRVQVLSDTIDSLHEENTKLVNKLKELKSND